MGAAGDGDEREGCGGVSCGRRGCRAGDWLSGTLHLSMPARPGFIQIPKTIKITRRDMRIISQTKASIAP